MHFWPQRATLIEPAASAFGWLLLADFVDKVREQLRSCNNRIRIGFNAIYCCAARLTNQYFVAAPQK
jgi:hypothetical protein